MRFKILLILLALVGQYIADYYYSYQLAQGILIDLGFGDWLYSLAYFIMAIALLNLKINFLNKAEEIAQNISQYIINILKVKNICFLIINPHKPDQLVSRWPYRNELIADYSNPMIKELLKNKNQLIFYDRLFIQSKENAENSKKQLLHYLEQLKMQIVVPIGEPPLLYGIILIGKKINGDFFSQDEINLLTEISKYLSTLLPQTISAQINIERALLRKSQ